MIRFAVIIGLLLVVEMPGTEIPQDNRPERLPGLLLSVPSELLEWEKPFVGISITNEAKSVKQLVNVEVLQANYALHATVVGESTAGKGDNLVWQWTGEDQGDVPALPERRHMLQEILPGTRRSKTAWLRPLTRSYWERYIPHVGKQRPQYAFDPQAVFIVASAPYPIDENAKRKVGDTCFGKGISYLGWKLIRCHHEDPGARHEKLGKMIRYDVAELEADGGSRYLVVGVRRKGVIGEGVGRWPSLLRLAVLDADARVLAVPPWSYRYHEDEHKLPRHHICFAWLEEKGGENHLCWRYRVSVMGCLYPFKKGDVPLNANPTQVILGFDEEKKVFFATCEGLDPARIDLVAEVPDHDPAAVVEEAVAITP